MQFTNLPFSSTAVERPCQFRPASMLVGGRNKKCQFLLARQPVSLKHTRISSLACLSPTCRQSQDADEVASLNSSEEDASQVVADEIRRDTNLYPLLPPSLLRFLPVSGNQHGMHDSLLSSTR